MRQKQRRNLRVGRRAISDRRLAGGPIVARDSVLGVNVSTKYNQITIRIGSMKQQVEMD